ncbi:MAG: ABC transporter, partial [Proteobacteria bacterium]|nr:ABC transporter [Pseudomonadota bacterium]
MASTEFHRQEDREKSKQVGAIAGLWPFVRPYNGIMALAMAALILTAAISLVLPIAVRQVVDGFNASAGAILVRYFFAALAMSG